MKKWLVFGAVFAAAGVVKLFWLEGYIGIKGFRLPALSPVNLCRFSVGSGQRQQCELLRAREAYDWESCRYLPDTAACFGRVSLARREYLCDRTDTGGGRDICSRTVMSSGDQIPYDMRGMESHRQNKNIKFPDREKYATGIIEGGGVNKIFFEGRETECGKKYDPPLRIKTPGDIFVTKCDWHRGEISLEYFKYDFPWQEFGAGI